MKKQEAPWLRTLLLILLFVPRAYAIELSLEENRAERGNIGYIDMQKLFRTFPETIRAKENFEEVVRQAEDQINLRKAELLRLRNELSQLKLEREFVAKTPLIISTAPASKPVAAAPADLPRRQHEPDTVLPSTGTMALPGFGYGWSPMQAPKSSAAVAEVKPSTSAAPAPKAEPMVINIPGVSTAPIVVQPPAAVAPAAAQNPALAEMDAKIAAKTRELAQKEAEFKEHQATTEKNLLDLESRKTELLLGKIHKAVQEVARREGISVVIDKSNILFGHDAVDLTDKVLKHLKGT